jgi:hypothetical protein
MLHIYHGDEDCVQSYAPMLSGYDLIPPQHNPFHHMESLNLENEFNTSEHTKGLRISWRLTPHPYLTPDKPHAPQAKGAGGFDHGVRLSFPFSLAFSYNVIYHLFAVHQPI